MKVSSIQIAAKAHDVWFERTRGNRIADQLLEVSLSEGKRLLGTRMSLLEKATDEEWVAHFRFGPWTWVNPMKVSHWRARRSRESGSGYEETYPSNQMKRGRGIFFLKVTRRQSLEEVYSQGEGEDLSQLMIVPDMRLRRWDCQRKV